MQDIALYLFCGVLLVIEPILLIYHIYKGLRTGVVATRFSWHPYRRDEHPIYFWMMIVLYGVMTTVIIGVGAFFGVMILANR